MKIRKNWIYGFVLLFGISGYPLVASITGFVGVGNSFFSIFLRGVILFFSLLLVVMSFRSKRSNLQNYIISFLLVFWFFYLSRVFHATFMDSRPLFKEPSFYWMWGVGVCLIPFTSLAISVPKTVDWQRLFIWMYLLLSFSAVIAFLAGSAVAVDSVSGSYVETGRLRLDALNPISVGHMGVSVFLLSVWMLLNNKLNFFKKIVVICLLVLGCYLTIAANSRGPLVAAGLCLFLLIFSSSSRKKFLSFFILIICLIVFSPVAKYLEDEHGLTTYSRILGQSQKNEENVVVRENTYMNSINEFSDSPIFGAGLEESQSGSYPHNIVIEAFLATGIFSGLLFLGCLIFLSVRAFLIMSKDPAAGWCGLLFFQYLIAAQFSGAIYTVSTFWMAAAFIVSYCNKKYN